MVRSAPALLEGCLSSRSAHLKSVSVAAPGWVRKWRSDAFGWASEAAGCSSWVLWSAESRGIALPRPRDSLSSQCPLSEGLGTIEADFEACR